MEESLTIKSKTSAKLSQYRSGYKLNHYHIHKFILNAMGDSEHTLRSIQHATDYDIHRLKLILRTMVKHGLLFTNGVKFRSNNEFEVPTEYPKSDLVMKQSTRLSGFSMARLV